MAFGDQLEDDTVFWSTCSKSLVKYTPSDSCVDWYAVECGRRFRIGYVRFGNMLQLPPGERQETSEGGAHPFSRLGVEDVADGTSYKDAPHPHNQQLP